MTDKPICMKHNIEMKPHKNGVMVVTMFNDPPMPYLIRAADVWICPIGGERIVRGFSEGIKRHHDGFIEELARIKQHRSVEEGTLVYCYEYIDHVMTYGKNPPEVELPKGPESIRIVNVSEEFQEPRTYVLVVSYVEGVPGSYNFVYVEYESVGHTQRQVFSTGNVVRDFAHAVEWFKRFDNGKGNLLLSSMCNHFVADHDEYGWEDGLIVEVES